MKRLKNILNNIYLCIRYPFLWPRNRFSGRHYDNWRLNEYMDGKYDHTVRKKTVKGIYDKAYKHNDKFEKHVNSRFYAVYYHVLCFIRDYVLQWFHCIPEYTEWDAMPYGWKKAFGNEMLEELRTQLKQEGKLYSFRIMQIKEKYGTLHFYVACASNEIYRIIDKYENVSEMTCITCGRPATKMTGGWICPYCDECFDKQYPDALPYLINKDGVWTEPEDLNE